VSRTRRMGRPAPKGRPWGNASRSTASSTVAPSATPRRAPKPSGPNAPSMLSATSPQRSSTGGRSAASGVGPV
jgi:hypothetical protein